MNNENYFKNSLSLCVTAGTSFSSITLNPTVVVSYGSLYIFTCRAIGVFAGKDENPTSTNFLGLRDLCQYVVYEIGMGRTTPAV